MNSTWEVYSYWDTTLFFNIFQGVSHFFGDSNYFTLISIGVTLGMLMSLLNSFIGSKASPMESVKYILAGALMFWIVAIPKSDVTIIDKSYSSLNSAPQTIGNIPTVLAFLAHLSTFAGEWMDKTYGQYFGVPSEMQAAGTHMTRKVLLSTVLAEPTNSIFLQNMTEFVRECVAYDVASGHLHLDYLKESKNFWEALDGTHPGLFITYKVRSGANLESQIKTCPQAYSQLTLDKKELADDLERRLAGTLFPGMDAAVAQVTYANLMTESMAAFMGGATDDASVVFQDVATQNVFLKSIGAITGEPVATTRAQIGITAGATQKAELAKSFVYTITIVQLLAYAFFPIVAAMVILAGPAGIKPLLLFVKVLFWLAILQASQVVLDSIILMRAIEESKSLVGALPAGSMSAWDSAAGIINGLDDQLQNALFASLALTWAMVSGAGALGGGIASGLFGGAQTYSERTGIDTAAEGRNTFGEAGWNNKRFHNTQGFDYNTIPNTATLGSMHQDKQGSIYTIHGNGNIDVQVSTHTGGAFSAEVSDAQVRQAGEALATATSNRVAAGAAFSEGSRSLKDDVFRAMEGETFQSVWSQTHGVSASSKETQAYSDIRETARTLMSGTDLSYSEATKLAATLYTEASVGTPKSLEIFSARAGIKGEAAKQLNEAVTEQVKNSLSNNDKTSVSNAVDFIQGADKNLQDTVQRTGVINTSRDWNVSLSEYNALEEKYEAARSVENSHRESHENLQRWQNAGAQDISKSIPYDDYAMLNRWQKGGRYDLVNDYLQSHMAQNSPVDASYRPPITPVSEGAYRTSAQGVSAAYGNGENFSGFIDTMESGRNAMSEKRKDDSQSVKNEFFSQTSRNEATANELRENATPQDIGAMDRRLTMDNLGKKISGDGDASDSGKNYWSGGLSSYKPDGNK